MTHIKIPFLSLLFVFAISCVYCQNEDNSAKLNRDRIKAQKVAFITQSLDLSVSEAQVFWPVYNEYDSKATNINIEIRKLTQSGKIDNLTDKEVEAISDKLIENQMQLADLQKAYYEKFKIVLPPKKVMKFYIAKGNFTGNCCKTWKTGLIRIKSKFSSFSSTAFFHNYPSERIFSIIFG